ncbi:MAG: adenosylmethionine decarboxylase [Candidatus Micrarchaeota archaeon]|nr:adenosylmethionine decarboxylase [Candidatus Micrarchaeota archaeon]
MFGPHLTIDLYGCDSRLLSDAKHIYRILDEMPTLLAMKKITKPQILPYEGSPGTFDKGGVSAFVMIATSHISIHTFVEQKYASVDIFSCKAFDTGKAIRYISGKFKAKKTETNLLSRGKEFPKEIRKATAIVVRERHDLKPRKQK